MHIKGQTTFELTNVETGVTRVIKEENMVTNAFKHFAKGLGAFGGSSFDFVISTRNIATRGLIDLTSDTTRCFTNGLFLFENMLDENPDHVFITADDPNIVGVGSIGAYSGLQSSAGSYNDIESGKIEKGYKHVWDFTTSQANGDIGCVCLTSVEGGVLGGSLNEYHSDWSGKMMYFPVSQPLYFPQFEDTIGSVAMKNYIYIDEGRGLAIRIKNFYSLPHVNGQAVNDYLHNEFNEEGKVVLGQTFKKSFIYTKSIEFDLFSVPFNNFSVFDTISTYSETRVINTGGSTATFSESGLRKVGTVKVDMPSGLAAVIPDSIINSTSNYYWPIAINTDEGFMYITFVVPKSTSQTIVVGQGEKFYTWKIDMNTFESSWFEISNVTGVDLSIPYSYTAANEILFPYIYVLNDYAILYSNYAGSVRGNMWVINYANGSTDIKKVVNPDGSDFLFTREGVGAYHHKGIVMFVDYNTQNCPTLNLKTGIMKQVAANDMASFYTWSSSSSSGTKQILFGSTHGTPFPKMLSSYYYNAYKLFGVKFYINPQFLMTINNLDRVVTKTSAETMKVTYTITQVDD